MARRRQPASALRGSARGIAFVVGLTVVVATVGWVIGYVMTLAFR